MSEAKKDRERALEAVKAIIGDRDPDADRSAILVTLEHAVALALLTLIDRNPRAASIMLNEGLTPGVEFRLSMYENRKAVRS